MAHSDQRLRPVLTFQGFFYLAVNLWALLATPHFLSLNNPQANLFEVRSFAALSSVLAIFFLVGSWRTDLLRPASFLGLGSALAIVLVELFHLPALGWTLLWFDLLIEIVLAVTYIVLFFFRTEKPDEAPAPAATEEPTPLEAETSAAPELPADEISS